MPQPGGKQGACLTLNVHGLKSWFVKRGFNMLNCSIGFNFWFKPLASWIPWCFEGIKHWIFPFWELLPLSVFCRGTGDGVSGLFCCGCRPMVSLRSNASDFTCENVPESSTMSFILGNLLKSFHKKWEWRYEHWTKTSWKTPCPIQWLLRFIPCFVFLKCVFRFQVGRAMSVFFHIIGPEPHKELQWRYVFCFWKTRNTELKTKSNKHPSKWYSASNVFQRFKHLQHPPTNPNI